MSEVRPTDGISIPNSTAYRRPRLAVPAGACDAHIHIYEPSFRAQDGMVNGATVASYKKLQALLGTTRAVVVQPRVYGTDNAATLYAISALGIEQTRGIAVVAADIDEAALQALHDGGIRGVRLSLHAPNAGAGDFNDVERLANKVAPFGWHLQLHWTADQIAQQAALLKRLPVQLVFDHLARLPLSDSFSHPAFPVVRTLLESGRAWVKLSGPYLDSVAGAKGGYHDTIALARKWLSVAPDRAVWGSDWPHVTEPLHKPDDTQLLELLADWCNDDSLQQRVLVDNPAHLYQFNP
ncbi:amidohydrolase family protein [Pusillimonas sp. MFBS29]|uniref:amidohydrolase family protein n=1 Tax=Pusillimonas sp. MFBS29 TaxID=2886690 RepID=UPI001D123768|nr:amidohydrolase family protein [Pusillimonas sp. MFBS29]MCC2596375.1 amidohydrolase family protein [Pusillimonas sp. MFBS29]